MCDNLTLGYQIGFRSSKTHKVIYLHLFRSGRSFDRWTLTSPVLEGCAWENCSHKRCKEVRRLFPRQKKFTGHPLHAVAEAKAYCLKVLGWGWALEFQSPM